MLDIAKLTPAPWQIDPFSDRETTAIFTQAAGGSTVCLIRHNPPWKDEKQPTDAEFIVLSRSDLGVRLRRGWHTQQRRGGEWFVPQLFIPTYWQNPQLLDSWSQAVEQKGHDVGLLTKADRWYVANVEAKEWGR